jgi:hypothetical protein
MGSSKQNPNGKAKRVQLILELRKAYHQFADLLQQYRSDSPLMRAALVRSTRQLSAMNRALALVALESFRRSTFEGRSSAA